jgi:sortase A
MRPDENRPATPLSVPARQQALVNSSRAHVSKEVAANIVRGQIDTIYQNDSNATMEVGAQSTESMPATQPVEQPPSKSETPTKSPITPGPGAVNMQAANQQAVASSPYERTHDESHHEVQTDAWRKYHSAWQSYYQQYYERYYVGQVHKVKETLEKESNVPANNEPETISSDEAMYDLRSKLREQINERAQKVRKSRHFLPVISALCVMLIFVFLQYNRLMFAAIDAYISPGSLDPSTLIVDPSTAGAVSSDPRLIVPKISVDVPIIWNADAASEDSLNAAMDKGVAWFNIQGASAKPGEKGNFALSGHSSNDWLDQGNYKFIFARLDQLNEGDTIYVNYNSTRYVYTVSKKQVVKPTDVSALAVGADKPRITLITCTPLGTALNRLLVFADQVSPDPNSASQATNQASSSTATQMPANSPTFLERLFGAH